MNIKNVVYQIVSSIKDEITAAQAAKEQQRAAVERAKQDQLAYDYMSALRADLFEALRDHKYGRIAYISAASDIRIDRYKVLADGSYVYFYRLSKIDDNPIARSILNQISGNINRDIASTHQELCREYGDIYVSQMYPFLYKGLYITGIRDTGGTDVTVAVQSYL